MAVVRSSATSERSSLLDVHRRRASIRSQMSLPRVRFENKHAIVQNERSDAVDQKKSLTKKRRENVGVEKTG